MARRIRNAPEGAQPFTDPAPGATWGRTDQGVDWSNVRSIVAVATGRIVNVYSNLRGFGQTIVEKLPSGEEVYYAEETAGTQAQVISGEAVNQGQTIASGGTGGVIEAGYWDPSTGRPVGAPGYREGSPTRAGGRFRGNISRAPAPSQPATPIARPGGGNASGDSGAGLKSLLQRYVDLRDTSRIAPPGTKDPTKWFLASFTGQWDRFAGTGDGSAPPPSDGSPAPNVVGKVSKPMLQRIAASRGWSDQEVDAWMRVIDAESGGNPNSVNKQTGAYGIAQMLASGGSPTNLAPNMAKYRAYGGDPSTVLGQLTGMAGYIAQTYGTPSKAWEHETSSHWY